MFDWTRVLVDEKSNVGALEAKSLKQEGNKVLTKMGESVTLDDWRHCLDNWQYSLDDWRHSHDDWRHSLNDWCISLMIGDISFMIGDYSSIISDTHSVVGDIVHKMLFYITPLSECKYY